MKSIAIFILFLGMILVVQGYYSYKYNKMNEPKVVVKYIPRSEYEDLMTPPEKLAEFYKSMFEGTQPFVYNDKIILDDNNKKNGS